MWTLHRIFTFILSIVAGHWWGHIEDLSDLLSATVENIQNLLGTFPGLMVDTACLKMPRAQKGVRLSDVIFKFKYPHIAGLDFHLLLTFLDNSSATSQKLDVMLIGGTMKKKLQCMFSPIKTFTRYLNLYKLIRIHFFELKERELHYLPYCYK